MVPAETNDLVAVARVVRTRGLKGEVVAEILTDFPSQSETTAESLIAAANPTMIATNEKKPTMRPLR